MSTIIIGAGVIGSTLALHLSEAGEAITILEGGAIGDATTSASFSMHIATRKTPKEHFDLAIAGGQEHLDMAVRLGATTPESSWIHPSPFFEWPTSDYEEQLIKERVERLQEWGYNAQWISRAELLIREPNLRPEPGVERVVMYPSEAWYDAPLLAELAVKGARRYGAQVFTGEYVTCIEQTNSGVRVTAASGSIHTADKLVIAAGASARDVAALAGCELQVNRVPGFVITTEPVDGSLLNSIILHPDANLRPAPGGRIVYHSYTVEGHLPEDLTENPNHPAAEEITRFAASIMPAIAEVPRSTGRIGIRPVPADGLPIVGWLNENKTVYGIAAHSAVNLAPILAKLATDELVNGSSLDALHPFRPGRKSLISPSLDEMDESTREMHRMYAESSR